MYSYLNLGSAVNRIKEKKNVANLQEIFLTFNFLILLCFQFLFLSFFVRSLCKGGKLCCIIMPSYKFIQIDLYL